MHLKHFTVAYRPFEMEAKQRRSLKAEQIATTAMSISQHP